MVSGLGCKRGRGILGAVAYKGEEGERRMREDGGGKLSSLSHLGNLGYCMSVISVISLTSSVISVSPAVFWMLYDGSRVVYARW